MINFAQILDSLTQKIRSKYPTVDITQEHQCFQENEDDVYQSINIVNVPESIISDVEDYAYGILRIISPEKSLAIGFFLFTPEETAEKFPKYLRSEPADPTVQIDYSLFQLELKPSDWQAVEFIGVNDDYTIPSRCSFDWSEIISGELLYAADYKKEISANTELAKAA